MADLKHQYGKHPVYLQMPHDLWVVLNAYAHSLGIPRSQVIFSILNGFLEPLKDGLNMTQGEEK